MINEHENAIQNNKIIMVVFIVNKNHNLNPEFTFQHLSHSVLLIIKRF